MSLAVLAPMATKAMHVFEHHEHEVCEVTGDTHFHNLDLDCEFYKFKISNTFYSSFVYKPDYTKQEFSNVTTLYYLYIWSHEKSTSNLRGPPTLS